MDATVDSKGRSTQTAWQHQLYDLLRKHNIHVDDVKERRTSLHHLRNIVRSEELTNHWATTAGRATSIGSANGAHIAAGRASLRSVLRSWTNATLPSNAGIHSTIAW